MILPGIERKNRSQYRMEFCIFSTIGLKFSSLKLLPLLNVKPSRTISSHYSGALSQSLLLVVIVIRFRRKNVNHSEAAKVINNFWSFIENQSEAAGVINNFGSFHGETQAWYLE